MTFTQQIASIVDAWHFGWSWWHDRTFMTFRSDQTDRPPPKRHPRWGLA